VRVVYPWEQKGPEILTREILRKKGKDVLSSVGGPSHHLARQREKEEVLSRLPRKSQSRDLGSLIGLRAHSTGMQSHVRGGEVPGGT